MRRDKRMERERIAGNTDTGLLKIIALICMITDHVGSRILTNVQEIRVIGRIAFPLYVWCMVVGACYTHNPARYALRLLIGGLIAQPFYMLGLWHTIDYGNVFFTLLLGYLAVWGLRENRYGSGIWAPALALLIPCFVRVDYGWRGVLLAILLYGARTKRRAIAAVMAAFCLFWGSSSARVRDVFGLPLTGGIFDTELFVLALRLQALAILALPFMLWQRKTRTPFPKWAAYAAYPGHLLILWIVQLCMGIVTLEGSWALLTAWM